MARNDFNRDGRSDILWQNTAGTQIGWSDMATGKMGAYKVVYNQPGVAVAHGDYNGDGYADIVRGNASTLAGSTSFTLRDSRSGSVTTVFNDASPWHQVGNFEHTDFTRDGSDDILVWNEQTGALGFYDMLGGWSTGYRPLYSQNFQEWRVMGADDFTGDGTDDILWMNNRTGESGYWEMNDGNVVRYVSLGFRGNAVETGDFTGDGSFDIVYQTGAIQGWSAGTVTVVDMDRGVATRNFFSATLGTSSWGMQDVGDYTGDGTEDLVFWNRGNDQIRYMDFTQNGSFDEVIVGVVDETQWYIM